MLLLVVSHEIEVTLTVTDFGVLQSVPLCRRGPQCLAEDEEGGQLDRDFAGFSGEHRASDANEVPEVKVLEDFKLFIAQRLFLGVNLDAPALIFDVDELALAHVAVCGDAAGQRDFAPFGVVRPGHGAGVRWGELVFERVDAFGPQCFELFFTLFDQRVCVIHSISSTRLCQRSATGSPDETLGGARCPRI